VFLHFCGAVCLLAVGALLKCSIHDYNHKRLPMPVGKHQGKFSPEHSFLQADADNVVITALKKAEDHNALILRFYGWAGKESDVKIQLPPGAESVSETNLMEVSAGSLPLQNGTVDVHTKPYEIKTLEVMFVKQGGEGQTTH